MSNTASPDTHLVYTEELINGNVIIKLLSRYNSIEAARTALEMILSQNRSYSAFLEADEVRIEKRDKLMKRWVIEKVENEKELNFVL